MASSAAAEVDQRVRASARRRGASSSGSPSCGCRRCSSGRLVVAAARIAAGRLVAQRLEGQRAAQRPARVRPAGGAARGPVAPVRLGGARRSGSASGAGVEVVGAAAQLEHDGRRPPGRRAPWPSGARRRRRCPTSSPGAQSTIGSAVPTTLMPSSIGSSRDRQCGRSRGAARTRCARRARAGEHAHQVGATGRRPSRARRLRSR